MEARKRHIYRSKESSFPVEVTMLYNLFLLLCSLVMKNFISAKARMKHPRSTISVPPLFNKLKNALNSTCWRKSNVLIMFLYFVFKVDWNSEVCTVISLSGFNVIM